jgi:ribulose-5-phosphate 4-epimerase/fuculose-1-phosphate aldolase
MHVHTTATMAVCCLEAGLSYTNFDAAQLYGKLAHHDFEGITVHAEEGARIVASAAGRPVRLLRNHGPVVIGTTPPQAVSLLWLLQRACELQVATVAMGPLRPLPEPVLQACVRDPMNFDTRCGAGQDAFDALHCLVNQDDPGDRR